MGKSQRATLATSTTHQTLDAARAYSFRFQEQRHYRRGHDDSEHPVRRWWRGARRLSGLCEGVDGAESPLGLAAGKFDSPRGDGDSRRSASVATPRVSRTHCATILRPSGRSSRGYRMVRRNGSSPPRRPSAPRGPRSACRNSKPASWYWLQRSSSTQRLRHCAGAWVSKTDRAARISLWRAPHIADAHWSALPT